MSALKFALFFALVPLSSYAAQITYVDKDATILKDEKVVSVMVNREPEISVYVVADSVSCRIFTESIEEALAIQTKLASEARSWVQCYGSFRPFENSSRGLVETDRYTLGQKLAE